MLLRTYGMLCIGWCNYALWNRYNYFFIFKLRNYSDFVHRANLPFGDPDSGVTFGASHVGTKAATLALVFISRCAVDVCIFSVMLFICVNHTSIDLSFALPVSLSFVKQFGEFFSSRLLVPHFYLSFYFHPIFGAHIRGPGHGKIWPGSKFSHVPIMILSAWRHLVVLVTPRLNSQSSF